MTVRLARAVGAGFSGIIAGIRIDQHLKDHVELDIFEKNHSVGGTWFENKCVPARGSRGVAQGLTFRWFAQLPWPLLRRAFRASFHVNESELLTVPHSADPGPLLQLDV